MHVAVITPPPAVVSLDEAKAHLRVDHSDEDMLIEGMVAAATAHLDGPDGVLNRALAAQVLEATIEGFPCEPLSLRCEPITSVNDVTYVDVDGVTRELDPDVYELTADGRLRLEHGQDWPATRSAADPVRILYTAGYPVLPPALRAAILLMTADLYANRESVVVGSVSFEIKSSLTVERLITPYRNRRA